MAAESKDLFAFRRGFTDLLPNSSLDYARDDSLVRNLKQLHKLQFGRACILQQTLLRKYAGANAQRIYRQPKMRML